MIRQRIAAGDVAQCIGSVAKCIEAQHLLNAGLVANDAARALRVLIDVQGLAVGALADEFPYPVRRVYVGGGGAPGAVVDPGALGNDFAIWSGAIDEP